MLFPGSLGQTMRQTVIPKVTKQNKTKHPKSGLVDLSPKEYAGVGPRKPVWPHPSQDAHLQRYQSLQQLNLLLVFGMLLQVLFCKKSLKGEHMRVLIRTRSYLCTDP